MPGGKGALGLMLVALAAPAGARADFAAPELFVSEGDSSSLQNQPPVWQPLGSAKVVGAYRYRLGVKLQATSDPGGRQYVLIQGAQLPHAPQQGSGIVPAVGDCALVRGAPGDIVEFAQISYYGDGSYRLTAALAPYQPGPCPASGTQTVGTFTADARPALSFVGDPRSHDTRPAAGFRGVEIVPTPDATIPEIVCARDPVVGADGSLTGSARTHSDSLAISEGLFGLSEADAFPYAGRWSCTGRVTGGPDNLHSNWSTPIAAVIPGDFHVFGEKVIDRTPPSYVVRFFLDRADAGGTLSFHLKSCRKYSRNGRRHLPRRALNLSAKVDARGRATFRFRRRVPASQFGRYFVGHARFSGTSLVGRATSRETYAFAEVLDPTEGAFLGVYTPAGC